MNLPSLLIFGVALGHVATFRAAIIAATIVPSTVGQPFGVQWFPADAPFFENRNRLGETVMFNPETLRFGKRDAFNPLMESRERKTDFNLEIMRFGKRGPKSYPEMIMKRARNYEDGVWFGV